LPNVLSGLKRPLARTEVLGYTLILVFPQALSLRYAFPSSKIFYAVAKDALSGFLRSLCFMARVNPCPSFTAAFPEWNLKGEGHPFFVWAIAS
jgi:hypothetical protein